MKIPLTPEVIIALVESGVNPDARDEDGTPILHLAALSNQNPAVISALVDAGLLN